jgi:hypothetical protein
MQCRAGGAACCGETCQECRGVWGGGDGCALWSFTSLEGGGARKRVNSTVVCLLWWDVSRHVSQCRTAVHCGREQQLATTGPEVVAADGSSVRSVMVTRSVNKPTAPAVLHHGCEKHGDSWM